MRLRAAAWSVFRRDGLAGTTVRAIASEAGAAVGGLYVCYPDKDLLLADLALAALAELGREVAARAGAPPIVAVTEALRAVFGAGAPASALLRVVLAVPPRADEERDRKVAGKLLTALAPLAAPRPGEPPDAVAARALVGACFAFGLVLLELSGQLARLGTPAEQLVAAFAAATGRS